MPRFLNEYLNPPAYSLVDQAAVTHSFSDDTVGPEVLAHINVSFGSAVWTANRLIIIPMVTARPVLVSGFFWYNGTAVNGNTDVGVYTEDGTIKLGSSGSTANAGINTLQDVNVTDFYLPPQRRLLLVLGCDSSSQTYFRLIPSALLQDFVGIKEQLSGWSSGLPTSLTLGTPTVAVVPMFGFRSASVI